MAFDAGLAERLRDVLKERDGISERKMFGGLAFMLRGHMFAGIVRDELMVRTGPARYAEALREPYAREMDFTGKPLKGMIYVAPEGFESDAALEKWIGLGLTFAESLPPK